MGPKKFKVSWRLVEEVMKGDYVVFNSERTMAPVGLRVLETSIWVNKGGIGNNLATIKCEEGRELLVPFGRLVQVVEEDVHG